MRAIVTFSLGSEWEARHHHKRQEKRHGPCPLGSVDCSDVTGAHHSLPFEADHYDDIRRLAQEAAERLAKELHYGVKTTRIELIDEPQVTLQ